MTILLVEDDAGHARLIEKNLRRAHMTDDLVLLKDGQAAVDYLFKTNEYAGAQHPLPHVILLDLNLPELDGYRVLEQVKTDERTTHIPVMILSTSDDPHDIERCTARGCQASPSRWTMHSSLRPSRWPAEGTPKVLAPLGERAYFPLQDRVIAAVLSDDLRPASGFP